MAKVITDEQAAVLSDLVYAVSTEGDNAGNYIFDNSSVAGVGKDLTLRDYIYETNAQGHEVFRKGIPDHIKKQITAMPYKYNKVLDRFQLRATSNTIDQGGKQGGGGWGYYGIAVGVVGDSSGLAVVNKGTSTLGDVVSDAQMAMGGLSANMLAGVGFIKKIQDNFKPTTISTTGHSAGGSIAQLQNIMLGNQLGESITFEAFGIGNIFANEQLLLGDIRFQGATDPIKQQLFDKYLENKDLVRDKTTNFIRPGDLIADNLLGQQLGEIIQLPGSDAGTADSHSISNYLLQGYTEDGQLKPNELDLRAVYDSYKNDLKLITQAEALFNQLRKEVGDKLLSAPEFDALYKQKLQAYGLDEGMLLDSRGRMAEFKAIFNQYENYFLLNAIKEKLMEAFGELGEIQLAMIAERLAQLANDALAGTREVIIRRDPLVLDLDGDGIETRAADGAVLFDGNADGVRRGTGWVSADDALLVRDLDGNGWIDNGRELFGDATIKSNGSVAEDGFDALRDLDSNADGVFDAKDSAFHELKIWQDKNQDGRSQENELMSLDEAEISAISLVAKSVTINMEGAIISKIGSYTRLDGASYEIGNLNFNQKSIYREFTLTNQMHAFGGEVVVVTMDGIGEVRDLTEAASLNSELSTILSRIGSTERYADRVAFSDEILRQWTKTSDFSDSLRLETVILEDGTSFEFKLSPEVRSQLDKIQVLETFSSNKLITMELSEGKLLVTHGSKVREYSIVRGEKNVLTDTHFTSGWTTYRSGWANVTDINLTAVNSGYESLLKNINENVFKQTEYPKLIDQLQFDYDVVSEKLNVNLDAVNQYLGDYVEKDPHSGLQVVQVLYSLRGNTVVGEHWNYQVVINKIRASSEQQAAINGFNFNFNGRQILIGTSGDDQIKDSDGADEIYGYTGDDTLTSSGGNDQLYGGTGNDILTGNGDDMLYGEEGDDTLRSSMGNNQLYGGEGNDTLTGSGGDTLYGEEGDDILTADRSFSRDTLIGGKGNDIYYTNNYASSTIVYNLGDGSDVISAKRPYLAQATYKDILRFGEEIGFDDLQLEKQGNNLWIQVGVDVNDTILIENFYATNLGTRTQIMQFEFADGMVIKREDERLNPDIIGSDANDVLSGTDFGEKIFGFAGDDVIHPGAGNDYIEAGAGDDTVNMGNGNKHIEAGAGDDTVLVMGGASVVYGGAGKDMLTSHGGGTSLYGEAGNDILDGGWNDTLYGGQNNDILMGDGKTSLYGGDGNDILMSIEGRNSNHNILVGGKGDDILLTDLDSASIIQYELGDGKDMIRYLGHFNGEEFGDDYEIDSPSQDIIQFGEGITIDDLILTRQGNKLQIQVGSNSNDQLWIEDFYATSGYRRTKINELRFADGMIINLPKEKLNLAINEGGVGDPLIGTAASENIYGSEKDDVLGGSEGLDHLYGGKGDDILIGNGGDTLYAGDGDDILISEGKEQHNTLIGGKGDDVLLSGAATKNVIYYNVGDGKDIIKRFNPEDLEFVFQDVIQFGEGIFFEDLVLSKRDNHLHIQVKEDVNDVILIENFYLKDEYMSTKVEILKFVDGTIIHRTDKRLSPDIVGTDGDDSIYGTDFAEDIYGGKGNDYLEGRGDDVLHGGEGDDTLHSNRYHNTLIGGKGNDLLLTGSRDVSKIHYSLGDGSDMIRRSNHGSSERDFDDIIQFGEGISLEDLRLEKQGNNLWMQVGVDVNDTILIDNFYATASSSRTKIMQFEFADGMVVKREHVQSGSDNDEVLIANSAMSYLYGGNGEDTYQVDFAKTEKTVIDNHDSDGSSDYLKLEGVTTDDIRFYRDLNHLVIKNLADKDQSRQVVVQNWFKSEDYQIDEVEAGNYGVSNKQIAVIIQTLATFNVEDGVGEDLLSMEQQDEINSVIANAWLPKSA